jgi:hypothetical protein
MAMHREQRGGISEDGQKRLDDWTNRNVPPPADLDLAAIDKLIAFHRHELARVAKAPEHHSPVFVANCATAIRALEILRPAYIVDKLAAVA